MTDLSCDIVAARIDAFIDGELSAGDRAAVGRHLSSCSICTWLADDRRAVGDALRGAAQSELPSGLSSLAAGVLGRLQAERSQTWRANLQRGVDNWHWLLVGSGSLAATFIVTLFVSAVLIAGPAPQRRDSLAGVIKNLVAPPCALLVVATPVGDDRNSMLMQVADGSADSGEVAAAVAPAELGYASERDLVLALAETVTQDGRLVEIGAMPKESRARAEALLGDINHMRSPSQPMGSSGRVRVRQIVLQANASVSAKGL